MSTVVVGEQDWLSAVISRRRTLGQDLYDEVWEGVYHVAPHAGTEHGVVAMEVALALAARARELGLRSSGPFNLGFEVDPSTGRPDYRVPDGGWFRELPSGVYAPTAAVVLEVLSPQDETYEKFEFYAGRDVEEVLVAHPLERWVTCYVNVGGVFEELVSSRVFDVTMEQLIAWITWP